VVTNTGVYALPVPVDGDVADVPEHIGLLVGALTTALNGKLTKAAADGYYQTKVKIQTTAPAVGQAGAEGDIIFVVP
jgi:hypothetical protein